jgi:hypothetical protein
MKCADHEIQDFLLLRIVALETTCKEDQDQT